MNKKTVTVLSPLYFIMLAALALSGVVFIFYNIYLAAAFGALTVLFALGAVIVKLRSRHYTQVFLDRINRSVESADSEVLSHLLVSVVITDADGNITWYNDSFRNNILLGDDKFAQSLDFLFSDDIKNQLAEKRRADVYYNDKIFTAYESLFKLENTEQYVYYFIDETALKRTAMEYESSRPVVLLVVVDNLDEIVKGAKDSERGIFLGAIESEIETWAAASAGIFRRLGSGRFLMVAEERYLEEMINDKFSILERVRALTFGGINSATLSIGVGHGGETLQESEIMSRAALDMALGRGGDQAAVKTKDEYEFFGGVSQMTKGRTSVRARVVASSIRELMLSSLNVLIVGHKFSDLDSVGSAYTLWCIANSLGRPARIVVDRNRTLATPLINKIDAAHQEGDIVIASPEQALTLMNENTLVIVTDTHRAEFLENREVYDHAKTVVVIDHHRKTVDYIDNAVIFYHEPTASSACELLTELTQYIDCPVSKLMAEALLSGIVLDTRNYVLRTGVRTFETSGYLRSRGANPVEVKRLFSISMDAYVQRAEIVAATKIYSGCAISCTENEGPDTRIAAAGAADEMLAISDVLASFVVFRGGDEINISARSFGEVNVQLVMEMLGGGGHASMAACQLKCDMNEAVMRLKEVLDKFFAA